MFFIKIDLVNYEKIIFNFKNKRFMARLIKLCQLWFDGFGFKFRDLLTGSLRKSLNVELRCGKSN